MPTLEQIKDDISKLNFVEFTAEKVKDKLSKLKPFKSPGPDGINPRLLLQLADEICIPLAHIYKIFLRNRGDPRGVENCQCDANFPKGLKV